MTKLLLRRLLSDAKREGLAQVGYLPMILLNLCRLSRSSNQTRPRSRSLRRLSRRCSIATMISAKDRTSRPTIESTPRRSRGGQVRNRPAPGKFHRFI